MKQLRPTAAPTHHSEHALAQLQGEISLLRRAVEGLTAERQATDYGPTLDTLSNRVEQIVDWARRVAETPLLRLTPTRLEEEIARIARDARDADRDTIELAHARMRTAIADVQGVTESAWEANRQFNGLQMVGCICFLASMGLTLALASIDDRAQNLRPSAQARPAAEHARSVENRRH